MTNSSQTLTRIERRKKPYAQPSLSKGFYTLGEGRKKLIDLIANNEFNKIESVVKKIKV